MTNTEESFQIFAKYNVTFSFQFKKEIDIDICFIDNYMKWNVIIMMYR